MSNQMSGFCLTSYYHVLFETYTGCDDYAWQKIVAYNAGLIVFHSLGAALTDRGCLKFLGLVDDKFGPDSETTLTKVCFEKINAQRIRQVQTLDYITKFPSKIQ